MSSQVNASLQHLNPVALEFTPSSGTKKQEKKQTKNKKTNNQNNQFQVDIVHTFSDFMALVCQKNMKPSFQAHAPACACTKTKLVQQTISSLKEDGIQEDGIIIVCDSKHPTFAYLCPDTSNKEYIKNNYLKCETVLYNQVFNKNQMGLLNFNTKMKIRCSACMLSQIPNATIVIIGDDVRMNIIINQACLNAKNIIQKHSQLLNNNTSSSPSSSSPLSNNSCSGGSGHSSGDGGGEAPVKGGGSSCTHHDSTSATMVGLHHDHAHQLIALPLTLLVNACMAKTRHAKTVSNEALLDAITHSLSTSSSPSSSLSNESNSKDKKEAEEGIVKILTVKLQHHITTVFGYQKFFQTISKQQNNNNNNNKTNKANSSTDSKNKKLNQERKETDKGKAEQAEQAEDEISQQMVLVLAYFNEIEGCWSLDLPGGKRHLGESSWNCARRETLEESSLLIDEKGIRNNHTHNIVDKTEKKVLDTTKVQLFDINQNQIIDSQEGRGGGVQDEELLFVPVERVVNCGMAYYLLQPPLYDEQGEKGNRVNVICNKLSLLAL